MQTPIDRVELISHLVNMSLAASNTARGLQKRRAKVLPSEQHLAVWMKDDAVASTAAARWIAKVDVPRSGGSCMVAWKTRGAKAQSLAILPEQRATEEEIERKRWNQFVCDIVIRNDLPVLRVAATSLDPDRALANCTGRARSRTLRKKVRTWLAIEKWLIATFGQSWPSSAGQVVDYLEDRAQEPCGRTVPATAISSLRFFEKVGEVEERLADTSLVLSTVSRLEVQLSTNSVPTKKAPMYFLSLLIALEMFVVCERYPLYYRAFAWYKLIKVWASLRSDDCMGLRPCHLKAVSGGIEFLLERTKTSGPGRRVRWLKGFVSSRATITENGWLEAGLVIWLGEGFAFERDYFLPEPNEDFSGCRSKPSDWSATSARSRALFRDLQQVMYDGASWKLNNDAPLVKHHQALLFWTDHSERNVLASIAAFLNLPKADRDYLGRWSADGSDEYLRTSRQVVHKVQAQVAQGIRDSFVAGGVDLEDCLGDNGLAEYLQSKGVSGEVASECVEGFRVKRLEASSTDDGFGAVQQLALAERERPKMDAETQEQADATDRQSESADPSASLAPLYFLSFTRKRKFARLHMISGCAIVPGVRVASFEYLCTVDEQPWNDYCKKCWPRGFDADSSADKILAQAGLNKPKDTGEDSSSTGSSSTDEPS
ncbi:unnamed protein product [Polarella glacialis]|uniref:Uncharacterized protein n=1 Tax=Polarella glacialis TaxID=89957 RepID=A0A813GF90_POLGL|nr:unnamed protein product [Polarella glacialis]